MPTTTPKRVARTAARVCATSSTCAVLITAAWGAQLWTTHPYLTLMVFLLVLSVSVVSGVAMVLAQCHLSIAQAFAAGCTVGQAVPAPPAPRLPALRAVD